MSKSSSNILLIAAIASIVIIGGFLIPRESPMPVDIVPAVTDTGMDLTVEVEETFVLDVFNSQEEDGAQSYRWQMGIEEIIEYAGIEGIIFKFSIQLDSSDNIDKLLMPWRGNYTCRVTRSNSDYYKATKARLR